MKRVAVCGARRERPARRRAAAAAAFAPVSPTPEIVAGCVALVTPYVIAAVLFGERIARQRACQKCAGSGLVKQGTSDTFMKRCPDCGGFLPWQSWRRFFLG